MSKPIVPSPEAAFGPAPNCVGIAQRLRAMDHNPIFVCDNGFRGVFGRYGFEGNPVDMSGGMPEEETARFRADFIAGKLPHLRLSPIERPPTCVIPVWKAIVDSAIIAAGVAGAGTITRDAASACCDRRDREVTTPVLYDPCPDDFHAGRGGRLGDGTSS
ncbi:MAG: hypothetical protein NFCOHLIN_03064 [Gammaproteobacteria bacterium]|nr:hypothetical protein [Gammaproteobacteria bacterium]